MAVGRHMHRRPQVNLRFSRRIDLTQPLTLFTLAALVVVFVVFLIYFVATPMHRRFGPERPFSSTARPIEESETDLTVYVFGDGRIVLGRELVAENELAKRLHDQNELTPGRQLVLEADRKASYAKIEAVFRAARDAGFNDVRIMTGARDPLEGLQRK